MKQAPKTRGYWIEPVAKPRMTSSDKYKTRPATEKYWQYKELIRCHNIHIGDTLKVVFYMPMPKSWSKKKREAMRFQPHQQKPDVDNLVKGLIDAALRDNDDCNVWSIEAKKVWYDSGMIMLFY